MFHLLFILLILLSVTMSLIGSESRSDSISESTFVTVTGSADSRDSNYRQIALTDALREAVRVGAQVDVLSETKVTNFSLEYDRIFTHAFGWVKNYTITNATLNENDKVYTVTLNAEVGRGKPNIRDKMALMNIISRFGSPRMGILVEEQLDGIEIDKQWLHDRISEQAIAYGMNILQLDHSNYNAPKIAEITASTTKNDDQLADLTHDVDLLITIRLNGNYLGETTIGVHSIQRFSISGNMQIIDPSTARIQSQVAFASKAGHDWTSTEIDKTTAYRHILSSCLFESDNEHSSAIERLFSHTMTSWMTANDLGNTYRLDFSQISYESILSIMQNISRQEKISAVNLRNFNPDATTILELESRLPLMSIANLLSNELAGSHTLGKATGKTLSFSPFTYVTYAKNNIEPKQLIDQSATYGQDDNISNTYNFDITDYPIVIIGILVGLTALTAWVIATKMAFNKREYVTHD